jgi:farnesol dehydrogenase
VSNRVLVTGATGLIGRYVVRQLLVQRRPVRMLVRSPGRLIPELSAVEVVTGDVRDPVAVAMAVRGCGTVLHLAGCARAWTRDPAEFAAVNLHGVGMLLDAARRFGVYRLVHVSTVLTLPGLRPAGRAATPYEASKLAGERLVDAYASAGRHAVVVHPTRVYGPGPLNDANGVTRLVSLYLRGPMMARLGDGDVLGNYVHAADVANGILLAAEHGTSGGHYVLGGENVSMRALLELVGEIAGVRRPTILVPPAAALAAAHVAELWGRIGGNPLITPAWVRAYLEDHGVDVSASRRELGYTFCSLRQGLEETIAWLRQPLQAA